MKAVELSFEMKVKANEAKAIEALEISFEV